MTRGLQSWDRQKVKNVFEILEKFVALGNVLKPLILAISVYNKLPKV